MARMEAAARAVEVVSKSASQCATDAVGPKEEFVMAFVYGNFGNR